MSRPPGIPVPTPPPLPRLAPGGRAWSQTGLGKWLGGRLMGSIGRIAGRILMVLAPVVLLGTLAGIIGYVRLQHGPVSLAFLSGPIEEGISAELEGLSAKVDDTVLRFAEDGGLEFRLVNLRLVDDEGSTVASAPIASVALSEESYSALRVVPRKVELIEPRIALSYSKSGGLALMFASPSATGEVPNKVGSSPGPTSVPAGPATPAQSGTITAETHGSKQINLARVLAAYTARARRGLEATSSLKEIGLRNARILLDQDGVTCELLVPDVAIDLDHRSRRSVITGRASIASDRGPWSISFLAEDSEKTGLLIVKSSIRDLIPSALGRAVPSLALMGAVDLPVAADATVELTTQGDARAASIAIELGRGLVDLGSAFHAPFLIDAGLVSATYDAESEQVRLAPSTVRWGDSRITVTGGLVSQRAEGKPARWAFDVSSTEGLLAAEEYGVTAVPIEAFRSTGVIDTDEDRIEIADAKMRAGGTDMALAGEISVHASQPASARVQGQMSAATMGFAKAVWPRMIAPLSRQWVGARVLSGQIESGRIRYESGIYAATSDAPRGRNNDRVEMVIEARDVTFLPFPDAAPVNATRLVMAQSNDSIAVELPDASLPVETGKQVQFTSGRLSIEDILAPLPEAVISFRAQAGVGAAMAALKSMPFSGRGTAALPPPLIDGKFDGSFLVRMPLQPNLAPANVEVEGKGRIVDVKSLERIGSLSIQSGTIDVDVTEASAVARGELIVNGILARLEGQRNFDPEAGQQPPLKLTATLDNSDRKQVGIDVNELVEGEVPVEVLIEQGHGPEPEIRVRADLSNAELIADALGWRKPAGRAATMEFNVANGRTHKTELQNFKIAGDDIAIEGWLALDKDNKLREFFFPDFSLNVVSRLEVQGRRNSKGTWVVSARGASYDAKDFFSSLLSFGGARRGQPDKSDSGFELDAEIENVLGHSGIGVRRFRMKLAQKDGRLTAFDARGTLDGGAPLAAVLSTENGARKIIADSTDAGQAMRLVGFYPNIQGGRVKLEVDLKAKGAAEKSGVLWVDNFKILGDPVVSEVFSNAPGDGPAIGEAGRRKVVREVFEFDRLKVPFSVGHGQFVMDDSSLKGPLLGATLRGKLDYGAQRINLGGTYVPLQGLNNALGEVPVLGQILSGPRGEGIFGITFAIQGPMARPQVIVNPLSPLAPGIFRELFQMTAPNPTVQPRGNPQTGSSAEKRARTSGTSSGAHSVSGAASQVTIDGWNSDTVVPSTPQDK